MSWFMAVPSIARCAGLAAQMSVTDMHLCAHLIEDWATPRMTGRPNAAGGAKRVPGHRTSSAWSVHRERWDVRNGPGPNTGGCCNASHLARSRAHAHHVYALCILFRLPESDGVSDV